MSVEILVAIIGLISSLFGMLLGAAFMWWQMSRSYVCRTDCEARHRTLNSQIAKLFTGVKWLVLYSDDVPEDKKATFLAEGD